MKFKIEFSKNTEPVPFTYISNLNGYLHKILGENNDYHDELSLYSTSFLHGGKLSSNKKYYEFKNGATWYISSPDKKFITDFIASVYQHQNFAFGMELLSVELIENDLINEGEYYMFYTKSPILLKYKEFGSKRNIYLTYNDNALKTSVFMKNIIIKKALKMKLNITKDDFNIAFNTNYENKKTRWIKVKSISNLTSVCPIYVQTNKKEIADFIYNVGVGHSTGSGFGFLL
jgi:CRISPR-associated endoribonuclease Cas6